MDGATRQRNLTMTTTMTWRQTLEWIDLTSLSPRQKLPEGHSSFRSTSFRTSDARIPFPYSLSARPALDRPCTVDLQPAN